LFLEDCGYQVRSVHYLVHYNSYCMNWFIWGTCTKMCQSSSPVHYIITAQSCLLLFILTAKLPIKPNKNWTAIMKSKRCKNGLNKMVYTKQYKTLNTFYLLTHIHKCSHPMSQLIGEVGVVTFVLLLLHHSV